MGRPKDMKAAQCQLCGKWFSRAGLAGHMQWKHGRDPKAPMVPASGRPYIVELRDRVAALEVAVMRSFDGVELKDAQGVVVGRFKVKKGAREATLVDLKGKRKATLVAGKGEAEKALLQLQK